MKTAAPDFREVMDEPTEFSTLVEARNRMKTTIAEYEAEIKIIDEAITEYLTEAGQAKVKYGSQTVSLVESSNNNLSKERLVELGVPTSIIQQATSTTKFTYVLVR